MTDMHSEIAKTMRQSKMSGTSGPGAELPNKCPELPDNLAELQNNKSSHSFNQLKQLHTST